MFTSQRVYDALLKRAPQSVDDLPAGAREHIPRNGLKLVFAAALQSSGDQAVNSSTVLPWLFHVLGVPSALTGLLVPIREAGSMLPQAFLTPLVMRVAQRKWIFVAGALVQAAAVAAMSLIAAIGQGLTAGVLILVSLGVFSLGRSLCSLSSKDVQGRTIPQGERGQINGLSTTASGLVAITVGLALRTFGGADSSPGELIWLLAGGTATWVLAAWVYSTIAEPVPDRAETSDPQASSGWLKTSVALLRDDSTFRLFVAVRSLLLVSALSPPFIVSLAVSSDGGSLTGLGAFIIAAGLSALIGGPIFGRFADRSSRTLMAAGAGLASAILLVVIVVTLLPEFDGTTAGANILFVASYFLLTLVHTGVRVARKTYIIDIASGDQRTLYVAVSNSAMGIILLATGAVSSLLSLWGIPWALLLLAVLGLVGVVAATRLPEVSSP